MNKTCSSRNPFEFNFYLQVYGGFRRLWILASPKAGMLFFDGGDFCGGGSRGGNEGKY